MAESKTATRPRNKEWKGPRYTLKRRKCAFCADKNRTIDYREPAKLRAFISDKGRIEPRRRTGTCARHQRVLAIAIKRSRHLALLPYVASHIYKTGGVGVRESGA
ncbi:MAG: 30S ribosomal protein S18 [Chloroflexota bacterium]